MNDGSFFQRPAPEAVEPPCPPPGGMKEPDAEWLGMLHQLACFQMQHGHCDVNRHARRHPKLALWLRRQMDLHAKGRLPVTQSRELEVLGVDWEAAALLVKRKPRSDARWQERLAELAAFKEKHGHLRVTLKNQLSPGMMHWRDNQRIRLSQGVMPPEQKARLDALDFEWECPGRTNLALGEHNTALWEKRFAELLAFRERHGHCEVTDKSGPNASLATWTRVQRRHFHENTLLPERRRRLEEIGFAWKSERLPFAEAWEERFAELAAFKEKHGHLRVTLKNEPSSGLMHWRDNQRLRLRDGRMPQEQKARLDALGFEWESQGRASPALEDYNVALWEERFAELLAFHEKHGHYRVPRDTKPHSTLASWILTQRRHFHENTLLPERRRRLEEIGFAWRAERLRFAKPWDERLAELAAFKEKHGHLRVTLKNQLSPGMTHWRDNQRIRLSQGLMKPEQKARLDALGFEWESPGRTSPAREDCNVALWEQMFEKLLAWRARQGHCQVPNTRGEDPALVGWVQRQRHHHKNNTLLPERRQRLEEIGFSWKSDKLTFAMAWEERFAELAAFKEKHGHLRVTMASQTSPGLAHWRDNQRLRLRAGKMPPEQEARLDALDMQWRESQPPPVSERTKWERHFERLTAFHQLHGHTEVPARPDQLLRKWVLEQRARHAEGSLDEERTARLEALGFSWNPGSAGNDTPRRNSSVWEERFAELAAFKDKHGHFRVPKHKAEHKTLHSWVVAQRVYRRKGSLRQEHEEKLDTLGFPWNPGGDAGLRKKISGSQWEANFQELLDFKERHGHTRVSHREEPQKQLYGWLARQRQAFRRGSLPPLHRQLLEQAGVEWHPGKIRHDGRTSFDERLEELRAFRARHGHANVPTKYPPNPLLGNWVSNTRVYRKNGRLSARQIQELDELGFPWRGDHNNNAAHADSWERRFASLVKYHENHGHANIPSTDKEHASLAGWLTSQRVSHRKGKLTEERTRKLESLGIRWGKAVYQKGLSRTWDQRLEELAAFRRQHGHPHVSKADKAHRSLEIWTKMQRVAYHKGRLSADQVRRLEALGFRWIGTEAFWERQFRRWQAATQRRRTRHLTPAGDGDDDLVKWEQTQRTLHRQGRLAPARAELLTRAGMILEPA